ncbi:hypothetical protein J421_3167 [Gemmatirosa kalamazoonensis]|uniref:Lipoprotein n=1 Tax=Gemmatirosa kalamazoonensis TaxID=861299 RepID=W0RHZ6_9BACT|nr:hypothetical protein [Gemmatirosa kalamazoonensis]AHG90704.1 hypothetical protein J421_3167 [Gemmatirosa kalamazoonensis]
MPRTIVHRALGLVVLVAGFTLAACGDSFTAPPQQGSAATPTDETEIALFVGDTLDLGVYMALAVGDVGSCTSDAPAVAEVTTSVRIVAGRPGDARLRCTRTVFSEPGSELSGRDGQSTEREYFHYAMRVRVLDRDASGGSAPAGSDEPTTGELP